MDCVDCLCLNGEIHNYIFRFLTNSPLCVVVSSPNCTIFWLEVMCLSGISLLLAQIDMNEWRDANAILLLNMFIGEGLFYCKFSALCCSKQSTLHDIFARGYALIKNVIITGTDKHERMGRCKSHTFTECVYRRGLYLEKTLLHQYSDIYRYSSILCVTVILIWEVWPVILSIDYNFAASTGISVQLFCRCLNVLLMCSKLADLFVITR
ncbi:hypothetical protein EGR_10325 [Echinococcus granulosus]|uniref:Uncharacterized protein n=1 Tax=Echinococcus granulosus TaxID=6210 RepID=W6U1B0_ECHGR|nr:hypothetical protein EGR_10325 [Echinococcus granulosus]EUB54818.1 hypothetical protein EGR_10325 [Echinococcus granulosus]